MWVDWLSHCSQDAQAAAVMLRDVVVTVLHQAADQRGGSVQHPHLHRQQDQLAHTHTITRILRLNTVTGASIPSQYAKTNGSVNKYKDGQQQGMQLLADLRILNSQELQKKYWVKERVQRGPGTAQATANTNSRCTSLRCASSVQHQGMLVLTRTAPGSLH
jgi:hypothetical protein